MKIYSKIIVFCVIGIFFGAGIVPGITNVNEIDEIVLKIHRDIEGLFPPNSKYANKCLDLIPKDKNELFKTNHHYDYSKNLDSNNKNWTWLFYNDADFTNGYDPFDWFRKEAFSGDKLNVIMLQDTYGGPAYYWHIDEGHDANVLEDLGEVNMGDYQTLLNFIEYGKEMFPADRYLLSFYNHGGGWKGACVDDTDNGWLTMDDIQKAITDSGGVDIVCHTAPCLMGAFESVYELRDCIDVYIGSEETSGYAWWGYIISDICDMLENNSDIDTIQLGEEIIDIIWEDHDRWNYNEAITMSAIRSDKMEELSTSLNNLAQFFLEDIESSREKILAIYDNIQYFSNGNILDIYDFAEKYTAIEYDTDIRNDLSNIMDNLLDSVIAECHGSDHPDANGLTIYFPVEGIDADYTNPEYGLDFSTDSKWDEFLELLCTEEIEPGVDQYQIKRNSGLISCAYFIWAQSFIPTEDTVKKVHLKLKRSGDITSDLTVSIRSEKEGDDLTSVSIPYDRTPTDTYQWVSFDFKDINITGGKIYYILLSTNGGDNRNDFYSWGGNSDPDSYSKGDVYIQWSSGQWEKWDPPFDSCFKTFFQWSSLDPPSIIGPPNGKAGKQYYYTLISNDPDNLDVSFFIEWGDGTDSKWLGTYESGEAVTINHTWLKKGEYTIKAKCKNTNDVISDWASLQVSMPKSKTINTSFLTFLQNHPNLFLLLQWLLQIY